MDTREGVGMGVSEAQPQGSAYGQFCSHFQGAPISPYPRLWSTTLVYSIHIFGTCQKSKGRLLSFDSLPTKTPTSP